MKKILSFLLIFSILLSVPIAVNSDIGVYLDGTLLSFDVQPQIIDGRTMVPLRVIFEGMGADVGWDDATRTVKAVREDTTVEMTIGSPKMYLNGSAMEMDTVPVIIAGRALVPARYVAENFGAEVLWDDASRNVLIHTNPGSPYAIINNSMPYFTELDYKIQPFENYSDLDVFGRCGVAFANICTEIMPTEQRGEIGAVKPTGWHTVRYDFIDGKYLYNRCHLIGFQLAGENANEKNLITGTRYLNVSGMLPFENEVSDYVKKTNNHVLYRVTPVFAGANLLADGVRIEAYSVEDNGEGVCFNVFCYNTQPGVVIDYETGDSYAADGSPAYSYGKEITADAQAVVNKSGEYIGNNSSKKFHLSSCAGVSTMKDKNKVHFDTREEALDAGFEPCKICNP